MATAAKTFSIELTKEELRCALDALAMKQASHERMTKGKVASQAVLDAFKAEAIKTALLANRLASKEIE